MALDNYDASNDITPEKIKYMIDWLSNRQKGVDRARAEFPSNIGVAVLHAAEVNRVFDQSRQGLKRLIDSVIPVAKPDMVAYSSWDALNDEKASSPSGAREAMTEALNAIDHFAPDPLGLGRRRIFISEYGAAENQHEPSEISWRIDATLTAAKEFGVGSAFWWEIYDNECKDQQGQQMTTTALSLGDPLRPINSDCAGHWLIRPDGTEALSLGALKKYWQH